MKVTIVPTYSLTDEASRIAINCRRSFYDSIYLSLAVASNGRLITADEKLCHALENTPLAERVVMIGDFAF